MRRSCTERAGGGGADGVAIDVASAADADDASASSRRLNQQSPRDKGLASLSMRPSMRDSTQVEEIISQQESSSPSPSLLPNPLEAIASALASLVASFNGTEQQEQPAKESRNSNVIDWRASTCFPARLAAATSSSSSSTSPQPAAASKHLPFSSPPSSPSPPPPPPLHDLASTGSRMFPILGRAISIYDFGVYVDASALRSSASAAALRAAAPGALKAAAAVSSEGGGNGNGYKKKRKILRFVPILPGLLDRRRDARARRQQQQQQRQKQQGEEKTNQGEEGWPTRHQELPRATFGEQLPLSEEFEEDPALPFGAALRSADDVPMSLVVRSRRALPIAILRAEYERILSRRIQRLGGSPDDKGLREMLSHFRSDALPPSARHSGGILNGFGSLAGLTGFGGIKGVHDQGKSKNAGALAKGAVIEFHRSPGGKLTASVDGAHVATVDNSVLLAAAVFDLYIGAQPVCGAARASAHEAVAAWVVGGGAGGGGGKGKKKKGGGEDEGGEGGSELARRLLEGGPRARATSGAAVCVEEDSDEGGACKRAEKQQVPKRRWGLLPLASSSNRGGGSKEILG